MDPSGKGEHRSKEEEKKTWVKETENMDQVGRRGHVSNGEKHGSNGGGEYDIQRRMRQYGLPHGGKMKSWSGLVLTLVQVIKL